jgi:hypothetical protein
MKVSQGITHITHVRAAYRDTSIFMIVSCLAYSSTLKMEARCSSETSVDFQRTTRRYIPEDGTLHSYFSFGYKASSKSIEGLKPYVEDFN